ncbi:MAG: type II toxin-antitoxin system HicB family antitoxin [Polyangiaceae bacterium]
MFLATEFDREDDGRWIAQVPAVPGALVYGFSKEEARRNVQRLTCTIIDQEVRGGARPRPNDRITFVES